jgi:hypothetical protein
VVSCEESAAELNIATQKPAWLLINGALNIIQLIECNADIICLRHKKSNRKIALQLAKHFKKFINDKSSDTHHSPVAVLATKSSLKFVGDASAKNECAVFNAKHFRQYGNKTKIIHWIFHCQN